MPASAESLGSGALGSRHRPTGPVAARSPVTRSEFVRLAARLAGVGDRVIIGHGATVDGALASFSALSAAGFDFDKHTGTAGIQRAAAVLQDTPALHAQLGANGRMFTPTTTENGQIVDPSACRGLGGSPSIPGLNPANKAPGEMIMSVPKGFKKINGQLVRVEHGSDTAALHAADVIARERSITAEANGRVRDLESTIQVLKSQIASLERQERIRTQQQIDRNGQSDSQRTDDDRHPPATVAGSGGQTDQDPPSGEGAGEDG